jgi:hypothetical protein
MPIFIPIDIAIKLMFAKTTDLYNNSITNKTEPNARKKIERPLNNLSFFVHL